jgi:hypothetical protein
VDEESLDLDALVVKETPHFSGHLLEPALLPEDDVAVPITSLTSVGWGRVDLALTAREVRRMPHI